MKRFNLQQNHAGFTLIEVMVSVSIFAIILTLGIGSLLTINNAYRKSQTERVVLDNLNFAMESMAREIRVGSQYSCGGSCSPSGASALQFIDPDGQTVEYYFDPNGGQGRIVKSTDTAVLGMSDPSFVVIDELKFFVVGEDQTDFDQPYVVISVTGTTVASNQTSTFTLQTSVSQRLLDRPATP